MREPAYVWSIAPTHCRKISDIGPLTTPPQTQGDQVVPQPLLTFFQVTELLLQWEQLTLAIPSWSLKLSVSCFQLLQPFSDSQTCPFIVNFTQQWDDKGIQWTFHAA